MTTTLDSLDISDLGPDADASDLARFCLACRLWMAEDESRTEAEAMEYLWGADGDWRSRADQHVHPSIDVCVRD